MATYYETCVIDIELVDRAGNSSILMDGQLAPLVGGAYSVFIRRYVYAHSENADVWIGTNLIPSLQASHSPFLSDIKTGVCTRFSTVDEPWGALPSGVMWGREKIALKAPSIMRLIETTTEGTADLVAPYLWVEDASGDTMVDVSGRTIKARKVMHYLPQSAGEEYNTDSFLSGEGLYDVTHHLKKLGRLYIGRPAQIGITVPKNVLTAAEATVAYRRGGACRWFASDWFDEPISAEGRDVLEHGLVNFLFNPIVDEFFGVARGKFPSYDLDDVL